MALNGNRNWCVIRTKNALKKEEEGEDMEEEVNKNFIIKIHDAGSPYRY